MPIIHFAKDWYYSADFLFTGQELDYYDKLERTWLQDKHPSLAALHQTFPGMLQKKEKELIAELEVVNDKIRAATVSVEEAGRRDRWLYELILEGWREEYAAILKQVSRIQWVLYPKPLDQRAGDNSVTDADIAQAKEFPLTELIAVNAAGFALCPFHEEKTGSLKYYKNGNRWRCFGACSTGGDVIDFVMRLNNINFMQAVKRLLNRK